MADFARHISKSLSQNNKAHKGSSRGKSIGGKVETRNLIGGATALQNLNKEQRFNAMQEARKSKREEMLMKRRGLNFVTEHHEELLPQDVIQACEEQLDNVAPKVVALVGLSEDSDTQEVRRSLVENCLLYQENQKKASSRRTIDEIMEADDHQSQFKAYLCPNPGSNSNMASKK